MLEVIELSHLAHLTDVIQLRELTRGNDEEMERLLAPRGDGVFRRQTGLSLNTKTGLAMLPFGSG